MEVSKQVANLELSKRLKELGYPQEGLFFWRYATTPIKDNEWELHYTANVKRYEDNDYASNATAPTVSEIGEMLPIGYFSVKGGRKEFPFLTGKVDVDDTVDWGGADKTAETEADARAKMLIYLLENKLISLDKI